MKIKLSCVTGVVHFIVLSKQSVISVTSLFDITI